MTFLLVTYLLTGLRLAFRLNGGRRECVCDAIIDKKETLQSREVYEEDERGNSITGVNKSHLTEKSRRGENRSSTTRP